MSSGANLWSTTEHALTYLRRADSIPHRSEGESALIEFLPPEPRRILDLGSGGGRLLEIVKAARPRAAFVALDFSPPMLEELRKRYGPQGDVTIVTHDMSEPLPPMELFDAVVSSFAIHHLTHDRKRSLYREIYDLLIPDGVFCNFEHVSSPSVRLHGEFLRAISREDDDPSNKLLDMETQLGWLREIGFEDVDCHWKWRELALLSGSKPTGRKTVSGSASPAR